MGDWPVRCFTCGEPIARYQKDFEEMVSRMTVAEALDRLGFTADHCRIMVIANHDIHTEVAHYERANAVLPPDDTSADYVKVHRSPGSPDGEKREREDPWAQPPSGFPNDTGMGDYLGDIRSMDEGDTAPDGHDEARKRALPKTPYRILTAM